MSQEDFIAGLLTKVSKLKEKTADLEKCLEQLQLNKECSESFEKAKLSVDQVLSEVSDIKDKFKKYADKSAETTSENNEKGMDESDVIDDSFEESNSQKVNGSAKIDMKPVIKLVDINKLVEQNNPPADSPRQKKSVTFDTSVIILTSSDEECTNENDRNLKENNTDINDLKAKEKRKVVNLNDVCKDKPDNSDDSEIENREQKKKRKKVPVKEKYVKKNWVDSDSEDDTIKSNGNVKKRSRRKHSKPSSKAHEISSNSDSSNSDNEVDKSTSERAKNRSKLSLKKAANSDLSSRKKYKLRRISIPLPKIVCEKLKDVYENNKELLSAKSCRRMDGLKRKRIHKEKETSQGCDDNPKVKKSKDLKKSDKKDKPIDDVNDKEKENGDEDVEKDSNKEVVEGKKDAESDPKENDESNEKSSSSAEINKTLDKDEHKSEDSDVHPTNNDDKDSSDEVQKISNKKNKKSAGSSDESDRERGKKNKESKDSSDESGSDRGKKNKKNSKISDSSDSDSSKKKNSKSQPSKSIVLSSDSEEEFFSNTKASSKEETSKKSKSRTKKSTIIDSDSDNSNKNDSADEFQPKKSSGSSNSSASEKSDKEDSDEDDTSNKKNRRRIKKTNDSSSDEEKSTRKQIRKVMDRSSLADTTKKAEAEERERKARILEKQKKYNAIFDIKEKNATVEKLVLDFDEKTKEELLTVDKRIVKKLKPHQASGIKFMFDACFESIERAKSKKGSGCILAHCMGLGKTLQVITLSHTLLANSDKTGVERIMVVCPVNTVLNWKQEFKKWLPKDDVVEVYELVSSKQNHERQYQVTDWFRNGGVLIIGYNMFRNLGNPDNKRISKKMRTAFIEGLVDPGPDLVICDEGHLLKNEKTNLSISMNRIKTIRRIVLTGTPLQNNLKEYWCMVQFVKPNLLGTYKEYLNRFVNPITNGQYTDSTPHDIQIMRKRAHVLHKMLDGIVQRRDYAVLEPYLPPKHEYVLFINLTEVQIKIYEHYMQHFARQSDGSNRTSFLFTDFQQLQRICTHPRVLLDKSIEDKNKEMMADDDESEGSIKDFIDDGSDSSSSSSDNDSSGSGSASDSKKTKQKSAKQRLTRAARAQRRENNESDSDIEMEEAPKKEWWQEFCDGDQLDNLNHSGKMFLLFQVLKECEQIGDKVLVFSQSLYTLNCIEYFLSKIDEATQNGNVDIVGGHSGSWAIGLDYFRLDGSSSCDNRATWCDMFNNPKNTRARLFLISTKAGGLGINLTAANRVIIFDVSWNPSHDIQSIYRVYRFGQTKPCYVYRFVSYGTMEMKVYERQVTKQAISKRVIDEQQIDRHYNQNDLQELYRCDLRPTERPTPLVPKDVLLGEMLQTYDCHLYKYHEHQSLLENKHEEELNEEERKAAWEEFENEKVNRTYQTKGLGFTTSNQGIVAALTNIVKRDNPTWSDVQVKGIIPALIQQLQVQIEMGDTSMMQRVQHEIRMMQAQHAQKLREHYYQQQVLKMIQQQQQQQSMMGNLHIDPSQMYSLMNNMIQGSSNNPTSSRTANDVIELN